MKGHSRMKLIYTFVIAAAILLGFLALSSTVSLNGRYVLAGSGRDLLLDTRTGDVWEKEVGRDGYKRVVWGPSE